MTAATELSLPPDMIAAGLGGFAGPPDWLRAVADPQRIAGALRKHVPELAAGKSTLSAIGIEKVRVKESSTFALYRLVVLTRGGGEQELLLRGERLSPGPAPRAGSNGVTLGENGWRCYLPELRLELSLEPEDDRALPALRLLTDPVAACAMLERALRRASPQSAGLKIDQCLPRVMRYERGSRCTVRYMLRYAPTEDMAGPETVVAKTHRGGKGETAYRAMQELWESSLRTSGTVVLAEPLAFDPELKVLVQSGLRHSGTLKELIGTVLASESEGAMTKLSGYLSKTAAGLAALHTSGVRAVHTVTWEDELAEVDQLVERLAAIAPGLRESAEPVLAQVATLASSYPADEFVPAHRSFRPAQVLLQGREVAFIDFDGFCLAEPALDLGLFCATLKDIGLQVMRRGAERAETASHDLAMLEELREVFLRSYETVVPVSRPRVALFEALYLLTAVLHSWTKAKFDRLEARLQLLRARVTTGELAGAGR